MSQLEPDIAKEIAWRIGNDARWTRWREQLEQTRYCHRPVRLRGATFDQDGVLTYSTAVEPGGVLLKACGNRREAICPPCSRTYKGDLWQLVIAGLIGGKGVPDAVAYHPMVFATFTAPSFGAVHGIHASGDRCRPRRGGDRCEHGIKLACWRSHNPDDAKCGEPICLDCFDYAGALIWNALAPELWRRTTIYIRRALAVELGLTAAALSRKARVSFLKVAEYQKRGLLHFHAIIRLDGAEGPINLPDGISTAKLENAIRRAAQGVSVPGPSGDFAEIRWGDELDISPLGGGGKSANRAAAYVAKYATKSTEAVGGLTRSVGAAQASKLPVSDHVRRFIATAHELASRNELADLRLPKVAHQLGFRGHWTTKSRRYSTTMGALREARKLFAQEQDANRQSAGEHRSMWEFAGSGHASRADLALVARLATEQERIRRIAVVERRTDDPRSR
ncbi:MAG: replication initiation protein [Actinobacteria bacterium]|nr:replication initiation protein [Actinomycetota bacterium]